MSDEEARLGELREQIDRLDAQIMDLISARAQCAQEVAHVKMDANPGQDVVFYRPEREAQVLRRIKEANPGPLPDEEMARLFREIMSACLALEQPMRVAFLGPAGTFTQAAALKHFGHSVLSVPMPAIDAVFREVESGAARYGVVPVENSTEGMVNHTLDMFISSPLRICGEVQIRIHHHLMRRAGEMDQPLARIYSHQQSFAQCRQWLDAHHYGVERITVSSNAEAARRAASEPGSAAIAGDMAAQLYDLEIVAGKIEDRPDNTTRFLVIGRELFPPSGHDRTSLLVFVRDQPGALYNVLSPLARFGVSMNRIESRPSHEGKWQYAFFIDIAGHVEDEPVRSALGALGEFASQVRILGSYPVAVL